MKPSGPGLLFVRRFLITVSISMLVMGLLSLSISSWRNLLYFLMELSGETYSFLSSSGLRWTGSREGLKSQITLSVFKLLEVSVSLGQVTLRASYSLWNLKLWLHTGLFCYFGRHLRGRKFLRELWGRENLFLVCPWPLGVWLGFQVADIFNLEQT